MENPFVVYHEYNDYGRPAIIIYVGTDKAAAFDALMAFNDSDASQASSGICYADTSGFMGVKP